MAAAALAGLAPAALAPPAGAATRAETVLVKVEAGAGAGERAQVREALGARRVRPLAAGWRAYELPDGVTLAEARERLEGAEAAERVQLDTRLRPFGAPDDPGYPAQWALPRIGAEAGWEAAAGAAPVTVAVIDTGVDVTHPDLAGRLWSNPGEVPGNGVDDDGNGYVDDVEGWNFADRSWSAPKGTPDVFDPGDGDQHGTHVAGTIAAARGNGIGIAGVSDNARILPLKFIKGESGYTSDAIEAIQYAIDAGAGVINASWGGGAPSPALCDAIAGAAAAGVVVVAAAGNEGADNDVTPTWPANCPSPSMVAVAATTAADALASFSNRGLTQVDLGAPGNAVYSTISGGYGYMSGTSMAAPHVSGIAATLLGVDPALAPWQVKAAITTGADPAPALVGAVASGRRASLVGSLYAAAGGIGPDATAPDDFAPLAPAHGLVTADPRPVFRWAPTSDAQSGLSGYRLVVDGQIVRAVGPATTAAAPPEPLADGARAWQVVAVDAEGNARATAPRHVVIDRSPPTAPSLAAPAHGAAVAGPAVDLAWAPAQDAVSGVAGYRVIVDGGEVAATEAARRTVQVPLGPGDHLWRVVAVDAAGNQATSGWWTVRVTGPGRAARPVGRPAVALGAPRAVVAGRRAVLRVRLTRAARVTFTVARAGGRPLARFARSLRAGTTRVRLPASAARRMARPGRYAVRARAAGGRADTVRLTVRAARGR